MKRYAFALLVSAVIVGTAAPALAQSQAAAAPADFSGIWAISNSSARGPLDAEMEPITGDFLTPEGRARKSVARPALDPSVMCLPAMPRHLSGPYPIQIVQTPQYLVMLFEWDTLFRIIYLDGRDHPDPDVETRWLGHSVGHWEGDELVVETTNFNGKSWLSSDGVQMSERARMTEHFRRTTDSNMEILVEVEDPENLAQPIFSKLVYNLKNDWEIKEYLCNEGNRDNAFNSDPDNPGSLEVDDKFNEN